MKTENKLLLGLACIFIILFEFHEFWEIITHPYMVFLIMLLTFGAVYFIGGAIIQVIQESKNKLK